ncbi:MAG: ParB/RepB/Spo0J family partition protein [Actinomycetota bacterium]
MTSPAGHVVRKIPVDAIAPGSNDRKTFDDAEIAALAESISEHGLIQPITVQPHPAGDPEWMIVAGERRWRAHVHAGMPEIRALVRVGTDSELAAVMLVENDVRVDLDPIERAFAYRKQIDLGSTVEDVARMTGRPVDFVARKLRLTHLHELLLDAVKAGVIPEKIAELIAELDQDGQRAAARVFEQRRLTWSEMRALVTDMLAEQNQGSFDLNVEVVEQLADDARRKSTIHAKTMAEMIVEAAALLDEHGIDTGDWMARARQVAEQRRIPWPLDGEEA